MKLCKDCRHFQVDKYSADSGTCMHPDVVVTHCVHGRKIGRDAFSVRCSINNVCGLDGVMWEPIPAAPFDDEEVKDEHHL